MSMPIALIVAMIVMYCIFYILDKNKGRYRKAPKNHAKKKR